MRVAQERVIMTFGKGEASGYVPSPEDHLF